jgi:hypothetical protein
MVDVDLVITVVISLILAALLEEEGVEDAVVMVDVVVVEDTMVMMVMQTIIALSSMVLMSVIQLDTTQSKSGPNWTLILRNESLMTQIEKASVARVLQLWCPVMKGAVLLHLLLQNYYPVRVILVLELRVI